MFRFSTILLLALYFLSALGLHSCLPETGNKRVASKKSVATNFRPKPQPKENNSEVSRDTDKAGIIRYTDEKGRVHYVTSIEKVPEQYRKSLDPNYSLPKITKAKFKTPKPSGNYDSSQVTVFVTSWCSYCRKVEQLLKEEGVQYVSYDIEKDKKGKQAYAKLGATGVPVVKIGKRIIKGYNKGKILNALSKI